VVVRTQYPEYKKGIYFAVVTALCWSVLAILLKYSLTFSDSGTIVWLRMSVASILIGVSLSKKFKGDFSFLFKSPKLIYIAALALAFNFYGYMVCIDLTTASNAQIMIQMGPLLLALSGFFFFKETPNIAQIVGFILAIIGFIFFYRDQLMISWSQKENYISGNIWIVFAAITWAAYSIILKLNSQKQNPQKILLLVFVVSTLVLSPLVNFNSLQNFTLSQWLLIVLLGLNSWVAYGSFTEALNRAPTSHVSLIITVNPLLTIFIIQMFDKLGIHFIPYEPLNAFGYLGAFFVVCGVAITILTKKDKRKT
jgi:drug/metabolite transporter (DMT)-like permease